MNTSFQFVALPHQPFESLFNHSDDQLQDIAARRVIVDQKPGYPCRISLADAEVGETILLVPYTYHDVSTPYRGSGPIYIREGVKTATPAVNDIPEMFNSRLLSVRGYDESGMLVDSEVVNGEELRDAIGRLFAEQKVDYLHIHNAAPGCYNCRVVRAAADS